MVFRGSPRVWRPEVGGVIVRKACVSMMQATSGASQACRGGQRIGDEVDSRFTPVMAEVSMQGDNLTRLRCPVVI